MKKLLVLSLSVLVSLFASCSSDDDSSGGGSLIGTWQAQSFIIDGVEDIVECETMNTLTFTSNMVTSIVFDLDSNGECIADDPSTTSYSVSGSEITTEFGSSTFEVNGDTLIITNVDEGGEGFEDEVSVDTYRRL